MEEDTEDLHRQPFLRRASLDSVTGQFESLFILVKQHIDMALEVPFQLTDEEEYYVEMACRRKFEIMKEKYEENISDGDVEVKFIEVGNELLGILRSLISSSSSRYHRAEYRKLQADICINLSFALGNLGMKSYRTVLDTPQVHLSSLNPLRLEAALNYVKFSEFFHNKDEAICIARQAWLEAKCYLKAKAGSKSSISAETSKAMIMLYHNLIAWGYSHEMLHGVAAPDAEVIAADGEGI